MAYDGHQLIRVARSQVRRRLRKAGVVVGADRVDDLAMEAICRAIESYDPKRTERGPIVLLRYKVIDVSTEAAEEAADGEMVMDPAKMEGVWT